MAAFNRISESEIGRIQELEAQGKSCKQISELTGRSINAVRKHLNASPPSNLPMGESEIAASFRQAKNPAEQVEILAQLNDTKPERILNILAQNMNQKPVEKEETDMPDAERPVSQKTLATAKDLLDMISQHLSGESFSFVYSSEENETRFSVTVKENQS